MATVVEFPRPRTLPPLDWERLEVERQKRFPKVPRTALKILKKVIQAEGRPFKDGSDLILTFDIPDDCYQYPPLPVRLTSRKSDILWVLDLLDRFGGELAYGKPHCHIRRKKKRLPVFAVEKVSRGTALALGPVYHHPYEHYVKSGEWLILGKDFPEIRERRKCLQMVRMSSIILTMAGPDMKIP